MFNKTLKELPAWQKLLFFLIITLTSSISFYFISILIASFLFSISITDTLLLLTSEASENNIEIIKLFQILQSIGTFIIPSIAGYYIFYKDSKNDFIKRIPPLSALYIIIAIIALIPIINLIAYANSKIELPNSLESLENKMKKLLTGY